MAHDVFVSYPSEDKTVADAVVASLEGRGVRCWVAPRDVPAGVDWAGSIVDAISRSRLMVLVFSDATNESEHILREVREAADARIPIMPFRTSDSEPSAALKYYIGGTHWLDALTGPLERHLADLGTRVSALLSDAQREEGPKPVPVPARQGVQSIRMPMAARVTGGVAAVVLVAALGVWAFGSRDDATDSTEQAVETTNPTDSMASPTTTPSGGIDTPTTMGGSGAKAFTPSGPNVAVPSAIVPSVLAVAVERGPSRICHLEGGLADCLDVIPIDSDETFQDVAFDDIDGDGRTDAVFATRSSIHPEAEASNYWCRNASERKWECFRFTDYDYQRRSGAAEPSSSVGTGDFNNDGYVDVVFGNNVTRTANTLHRAEVCLGGFGPDREFACALLPDVEIVPEGGAPVGVNDLAVADLDEDGNLDVVLAGWMSVHEVCFGVGDLYGTFGCVQIESEGGGTFVDVAVGDLDADGVLDILFASGETPSRWCRGIGGRQFACEDIGEPRSGNEAVSVADLDDDGFQDALFGYASADDATGRVEVCFGPLTPGVTCDKDAIVQRVDVQGGLLATDLTGDGATDLFVLWAPGMTACLGDDSGDLSCGDLPGELFIEGFDGQPHDYAFVGFAWAPTG